MILEAVPSGEIGFRRFLQSALIMRCDKNPRYSLRAFSQSLKISHATLSHLMAGRRPLTPKMIRKLGSALDLDPHQIEKYVSLHRGHRAEAFTEPVKEEQRYRELTQDVFNVVSEWYHDAISELTHLKNFKNDRRWIAKVLGLTVSEVNVAVERLQRLDLLEITAEGKWIDLSRNSTTTLDTDYTNAALRKYQKKILELSGKAVDTVVKSEREHVSNMVSIQKQDLLEVKKRINAFRWELTAFLQRKEVSADQVYQLAISFFPITKSFSDEESKS